jgi:hypothetical protein
MEDSKLRDLHIRLNAFFLSKTEGSEEKKCQNSDAAVISSSTSYGLSTSETSSSIMSIMKMFCANTKQER